MSRKSVIASRHRGQIGEIFTSFADPVAQITLMRAVAGELRLYNNGSLDDYVLLNPFAFEIPIGGFVSWEVNLQTMNAIQIGNYYNSYGIVRFNNSTTFNFNHPAGSILNTSMPAKSTNTWYEVKLELTNITTITAYVDGVVVGSRTTYTDSASVLKDFRAIGASGVAGTITSRESNLKVRNVNINNSLVFAFDETGTEDKIYGYKTI